ncbi:hypothetical protein HBN54_002423 [Hymenobacter sp. 1B]|uniref:Uncharacterized protein n=1 Tax=Hymenobacter artigasi TaxID=2719616 RepID=A0ABX1HHT7_9BACT|nr:hypothetical protein [Hymenobacter artigasi]
MKSRCRVLRIFQQGKAGRRQHFPDAGPVQLLFRAGHGGGPQPHIEHPQAQAFQLLPHHPNTPGADHVLDIKHTAGLGRKGWGKNHE